MIYQRIRYFLKAAEMGSFSKAAEQMFLSAQALTKQINLLEEEVGGKLFERTRKGISLTPLGEHAKLKFGLVDHELNSVLEELKQQASDEKKRINIGIFSALPQDDLVSPVISFLLSEYHEYQISLEMVGYSEGRTLLLNKKIDLLLTHTHAEDEWMGYQCLYFDVHEAKVAISLLHPWAVYDKITPEDMKKETFLKLRTKENHYLVSPEKTFYNNVPCKNVQEVNNFRTQLALLHQGKGFAIFPDAFSDAEQSKVMFFDYPGEPLLFYSSLIYQKDNVVPWIHEVVEGIRNEFSLKDKDSLDIS